MSIHFDVWTTAKVTVPGVGWWQNKQNTRGSHFSTVMESSKIVLKRRKPVTNSRTTLTWALVGLLVLSALLISVLYARASTGESTPHNTDNSEEYAALLRRAKALTEKYSELTGRAIREPHELDESKVSNQIGDGAGKGSKNLVIGMAQDTDSKNLVVFCKSLRRVSNADVVLFVNNPVPERHARIAEETRVTLIPFDLNEVQPSFMQTFHPSTLRWPLFHAYFQEHDIIAHYGRIWMIDVRDSFFQSDPFAFIAPSPAPGSLHVFNGVESFPIKECGWNSGWIKDCFGPQVLADVGKEGIICSGVTAGTADSVTDYVRIMSEIITGKASEQNLPAARFPQCERNGVDQGVHNVLVHSGALSHLHLRRWSQTDSPVANMQAKAALLNCEGQEQEQCLVRNRAGVSVAVVHQYDRYPQLQQFLFRKYVDWVKTGDLRAEWDFEPSCRTAYEYRAETDLFKGICDMPHKGGVTSAAACCAMCDERRAQGCEAFTFFAGTCYFKNCGRGGKQGTARSLPGAISAYLK